jgi:(p)ppGpp synthase/HD superfamily hydrolase
MTSSSELLNKANEFATRKHKGQVDKGGEPYIGHPRRVMDRVEGTDAKIVAILHDVLEDTDATPADLASEGIPPHVIRAVEILTRERYDDFIRRVRDSGDVLALAVKHADIADNLDENRLGRLSEEKQIRLRAKYRHAQLLLDGEVPSPSG